MIAIQINDVKVFMAQFLAGTTFDRFRLIEGNVTTFCTYHIDGSWQKDFDADPSDSDFEDAEGLFSSEERWPENYIPWSRVREFCFSVIKGRKTPLGFKFVFQLGGDDLNALLLREGLSDLRPDINGLYLNLSFRERSLLLTTGTSRKTFTMDRELDTVWDSFVESYLLENRISFERI